MVVFILAALANFIREHRFSCVAAIGIGEYSMRGTTRFARWNTTLGPAERLVLVRGGILSARQNALCAVEHYARQNAFYSVEHSMPSRTSSAVIEKQLIYDSTR